MNLSEQLLKKFQEQHLTSFGSRISAKQAELELLELAELVRLTHLTEKEEPNYESGNDN